MSGKRLSKSQAFQMVQNMQISVTREFSWEMGHALLNHAGKCFRPHGHNYRMEVEVSGQIVEATSMVLDFATLDELVKPHIDDLDHRFLVHIDDTRFGNDYECIKWDMDPTAECISAALYWAIEGSIADKDMDITLERVTLYETDKASATVRRS